MNKLISVFCLSTALTVNVAIAHESHGQPRHPWRRQARLAARPQPVGHAPADGGKFVRIRASGLLYTACSTT